MRDYEVGIPRNKLAGRRSLLSNNSRVHKGGGRIGSEDGQGEEDT